MRLHEAIEKMGEDGKVRRQGWVDGAYIFYSGTIKYHYGSGGEDDDWRTGFESIAATDWEVVDDKPVIEVGDVVGPLLYSCKEHRVIHIHRGVAWTIGPSGNCYQAEIDSLTLIRKGSDKYTGEYHYYHRKPTSMTWDNGLPEGKYKITAERMTLEETVND